MSKAKFPDTTFLKAGSFYRNKILLWYKSNKEAWPWRQLWEEHGDPYHVWLSEVMLQQTVIKAALPAYIRFIDRFPKVQDLAVASTEEVRLQCAGLGYYRRFNLMHHAAQTLAPDGNFQGWPESYREWRILPGVGDYTAAAISSIVLGESVAVVDGNIERLMCRLLDIRLPPNLPYLKRGFGEHMTQLLGDAKPGDFNQGMMEFGQKVCTPTNPRCDSCPFKGGCRSYVAGSQHLAPQKKIKKDKVRVDARMLILRNGQNILLSRRPESSKFLKGTLGFPTFLKLSRSYSHDGELNFPEFDVKEADSVGKINHTITHHQISAEVLAKSFTEKRLETEHSWVPFRKVEAALVSSLDRKAWRAFVKNGVASS